MVRDANTGQQDRVLLRASSDIVQRHYKQSPMYFQLVLCRHTLGFHRPQHDRPSNLATYAGYGFPSPLTCVDSAVDCHETFPDFRSAPPGVEPQQNHPAQSHSRHVLWFRLESWLAVRSHATPLQHENGKQTYPFILPQVSIFVVRWRQVRSRRAHC